jgi:hypothetical protein
LQLEQFASTDLFASADHKNMDYLISESLVVPDSQMDLTTNRLFVILPPGNPGNLETLYDLSMLHIQLIMAVSILTGTPLAHIHVLWPFRGKAFLDVLVDLPILLPASVAGIALRMAFGRQGLSGNLLNEFGISIS